MKNSIYLYILICFTAFGLITTEAVAQTPIDLPCAYEDNCIIIGYESVTPIANSTDLRIVMSYRIGCTNVASIAITPVKSQNILITRGSFALGEVYYIEFRVNRNSFYASNPNQDSRLRVRINYDGRPNVIVDLHYLSEEDCQQINPLPVEFTSFKGKATASGINLMWETASEQDNSHFEVERSTDGSNFMLLSTVQGNGTTAIPMKYSATDKMPQKGTNHYRLKQVDFDNTASYSKTITVAWKADDALTINLLPNPCRGGNCNISINNAANTETLVQLRDMAGRTVFSKTVTSDSYLLELPMTELTHYKGLYFLTATTTAGQVVYQRVVLE
jgi:hypothetical protein